MFPVILVELIGPVKSYPVLKCSSTFDLMTEVKCPPLCGCSSLSLIANVFKINFVVCSYALENFAPPRIVNFQRRYDSNAFMKREPGF